jgi:hypothetical protein
MDARHLAAMLIAPIVGDWTRAALETQSLTAAVHKQLLHLTGGVRIAGCRVTRPIINAFAAAAVRVDLQGRRGTA